MRRAGTTEVERQELQWDLGWELNDVGVGICAYLSIVWEQIEFKNRSQVRGWERRKDRYGRGENNLVRQVLGQGVGMGAILGVGWR